MLKRFIGLFLVAVVLTCFGCSPDLEPQPEMAGFCQVDSAGDLFVVIRNTGSAILTWV